MRLLEGAVLEPEDAELLDLRDLVRELKSELAKSRMETTTAQREAVRAVSALRKQLSPLYRSLQAVFGELDSVIGDEEPRANAQTSPIWESWKSKLPGQPAKIIDALLLHGEMNSQQIAIHIGIHRNNVPPLIHKLNKAGVIKKNGHMYSLKTL